MIPFFDELWQEIPEYGSNALLSKLIKLNNKIKHTRMFI